MYRKAKITAKNHFLLLTFKKCLPCDYKPLTDDYPKLNELFMMLYKRSMNIYSFLYTFVKRASH